MSQNAQSSEQQIIFVVEKTTMKSATTMEVIVVSCLFPIGVQASQVKSLSATCLERGFVNFFHVSLI